MSAYISMSDTTVLLPQCVILCVYEKIGWMTLELQINLLKSCNHNTVHKTLC